MLSIDNPGSATPSRGVPSELPGGSAEATCRGRMDAAPNSRVTFVSRPDPPPCRSELASSFILSANHEDTKKQNESERA